MPSCDPACSYSRLLDPKPASYIAVEIDLPACVPPLNRLHPRSFRILSRRNTHDFLKSSLQMKRTDSGLRAQRSERRRLTVCIIKQTTNASHKFDLRIVTWIARG